MVRVGPVVIDRNVVDIGRILAPAAPRVSHVMEVVGAEHVPAHTPARSEAFVGHLHSAEPDLVNAANVPAQVVQTAGGRFGECQHVMIAAMDAVHKGDAVAGSVGQSQPKNVAIESD